MPADHSCEPAGSGIVVVDKPAGWTSHQVVGRLRRLLGTRKIGHAGTLDPMATGVLVCGVNRATRLLGHLMLTEKSYVATIRLGSSTITDDAEGEIIATADASAVGDADIAAGIEALRGEIDQVPTAVSAIKINGVRAYAKVRAGEQVELAARRVTVSRFEVLATRRHLVDALGVVDLDVEVDCSSGTYIRALARDLGAALGVGGHLTRLRRTKVGPFADADAQSLDGTDGQVVRMIDLADVARGLFPTKSLDAEHALAARRGQRLTPFDTDTLTAVFDHDQFIGLYRGDGRAEAIFVSG